MAIGFRAGATQAGTHNGTSIAISFTEAVGDTLAVCIVGTAGMTVTGVSDGANTFTQGPHFDTNVHTEIWYSRNIASAQSMITISLGGTHTESAACVMAYTGVQAIGNNDAGQSGTSTAPAVTVTTQDANNFIVMCAGGSGSATFSTNGSAILEESVGSPTTGGKVVVGGYDESYATAASNTLTGTLSASEAWSAVGLELRSASSSTYNVSMSAGVTTGASTAGPLTMNASASAPVTLGAVPAGALVMNASASAGVTLDATTQGGKSVSDSISAGITTGATNSANITFSLGISLGVTLLASPSSAAQFSTSISLAASVGVTTSSAAIFFSQVSAAATLDMVTSSGMLMSANMSVGASLGASTLASLSMPASVSAALMTNFTVVGVLSASASASFGAILSEANSASSIMGAAISIATTTGSGASASLTASASVSEPLTLLSGVSAQSVMNAAISLPAVTGCLTSAAASGGGEVYVGATLALVAVVTTSAADPIIPDDVPLRNRFTYDSDPTHHFIAPARGAFSGGVAVVTFRVKKP